MMKVAVRNGITDLQEIRKKYNEFAEGGGISDEEYIDTMEKVAEENYKKWGFDNPEEALVHALNDNTYNYRGYYNKHPQSTANADTHWTDEFKTVYHPTFSNQSVYSGKKSQYNPSGRTGGFWLGENLFVPAPWQLFGDYASGGKIHIKPSHRGRLTELKKRTGKSEAELYRTGSPATRKMITFARNARKWKHELGGPLVKGLLENRYAPGGDITPMNYEYRGTIHSDELKNQGITHVAELPEIVITGRDLKKPYVSSFDGSTEPYVELFGALSKGFQPLSISQHVGAAFDAAQGKRNYFESLFNGNSGFFTDAYAAEHPWVSTLGNMAGDTAIPLGSTMIKGAKGFVISSPKYRLKTPSTTKPDLINFGNVEDGTFRFMGFEEDPIQMHLKRAKAKGYDTTGIEVYDLSKDTPENTAIIEKIAKQYGMTPEDTKTFLLNHLGSYGHAANLRDTKIILHDGIGDNMSARISHEINHLLHKPDAPIPDGSYYPRILKRPDKYFTKLNNTELAARGSQLHDYFGHTGNEPITEEMLEYARQHYIQDTGLNNNMRDFLWTIKDNKKVAEWLTKHATGIVPLGLFGTTMYNTNNE